MERPSPIQPLNEPPSKPDPSSGYDTFAEAIRDFLAEHFADRPIPHGAWSGIAFELGCSPTHVGHVAHREGFDLYVWQQNEK